MRDSTGKHEKTRENTRKYDFPTCFLVFSRVFPGSIWFPVGTATKEPSRIGSFVADPGTRVTGLSNTTRAPRIPVYSRVFPCIP